MSPERAYSLGLKIASEVWEVIAEQDNPTPDQAAAIVLAAARRMNLSDDDAGEMIRQWPKVMARITELRERVVEQEAERLRLRVRHVHGRA